MDGRAYERHPAGASRFRELVAWQKAYHLALEVYRRAAAFPSEERFGLAQQLRRAAVSIASNIAEGWGRTTTADYVRFLGMARGSFYETQTDLWLATDLGYMPHDDVIHSLVIENERLLNALINRLNEKLPH